MSAMSRSRAWESLGIEAFRAYQVPFLVTSRSLLDRAVTGPVAAGLLASLKPAKVTGLAIVPTGIRYLLSTRPLTTPAQFYGAKIRINDSVTSSEVITALGATPVTNIASGPAAVQALRDGKLTAIETDPVNAMQNGYLQVAPYVLVNAPLFAKTTTLALSSAVLARLPAADAGWLREAAVQAAAGQAGSTSDRVDWASMCAQGLKPLAATRGQFKALHDAEASTYADLAGDPHDHPGHRPDRWNGHNEPRMDNWATCHGVGVAASPTKVLDGRYGLTYTQAEVVASGDCADCGNAGTYTLTIHDGRYAIFHPVQLHSNPTEPDVEFFRGWRPSDPVEVGAIFINGNQATLLPEVNQQNGTVPAVFTFELFRGVLTWHLVSGPAWEQVAPLETAELSPPPASPPPRA